MPAPQLTWNPDEARQNLARAEDLDRACKAAVARERDRVCEIVLAFVPPGRRDRLLRAIRSGEPAPNT
jgi:hypothetical protein